MEIYQGLTRKRQTGRSRDFCYNGNAPIELPQSPQIKRNSINALQLHRTKKENQGMDRKNEGQKVEHSEAAIIARAIHSLADAIREHARAMKGEDAEADDGEFDLAGERIA